MKEAEPLRNVEDRYKMRRLTDDEMETLRVIARKGRTGPALALRHLWGLITREALGLSYEEASDLPYLLRVQNYSVAEDQMKALLEPSPTCRRARLNSICCSPSSRKNLTNDSVTCTPAYRLKSGTTRSLRFLLRS